MFKRTALGLANEHLFHRVDYMVYCEGESVDNVSLSLDEAFWITVFSAGNKIVRVKSIGSKTNAIALLGDIRNGTLKNTIVAMDSDYSFFTKEQSDHPQVFFTHGYSWESDVIQDFEFSRALSLFCNVRDINSAKVQFEQFISASTRSFWRATLVDMRYIESPGKLFNRQKPVSIIRFRPDGYPRLACEQLVVSARALKNTGKMPKSIPFDGPSCGIRYFFGKTVARFVYHWFVNYSSRVRGKQSVTFDTFMSALIGGIDVRLGSSRRDAYFRRALAQI
jgi:hypothetical protein